MVKRLVTPMFADLHVHFRRNELLEAVVPASAATVAMANVTQPVTGTRQPNAVTRAAQRVPVGVVATVAGVFGFMVIALH